MNLIKPAQIASLLLIAAFAAEVSAHGFIPLPLESANALDDRMRGIRIQQAVSTFPPVEDDISTVLNNDTESFLSAPIPRYGQLINTHVVASTLRFLNCPCLVLKQTGSFSGVVV